MGTLVGGVELLHVVADGLEHLRLVVPYLVRTPLPAVNVGEERSRCSHVDDVGIALEARHMGSLEDGGLVVVPLLALAVTGIFASKHLRALAVVGVIAQAMAQEPLFVTIVVLVVEVYLQLLHAGLQEVEVPALTVRASGADELQVRILLAQCIAELLQALCKHGAIATMCFVVVPLLVAHTQVFQVEGCGVPHVGTHLTPLRGDVAIGKLHKVEGILDVGAEVVECHMYARLRRIRVLELTRQSARDDRQGLSTDVLRELEELKKAQSVRLVVVGEVAEVEGVLPAVVVQRTVLYRTHAVLPLVALVERATLHDASAREAEDAWVQVFQGLGEVATHAVLTILIGIDRE